MEDPRYRVPGRNRTHCWVCPNGHFVSAPGTCPVQGVNGKLRCWENTQHIENYPVLWAIWLIEGLEGVVAAWKAGCRE